MFVLICHFADTTTLNKSPIWQYYAMLASLSLSLAYLAVFFMKWVCSKSKVVDQWKKRLKGEQSDEKMLLHTLPYYLAITRSSCEVKACLCWTGRVLTLPWLLILSFSTLEANYQKTFRQFSALPPAYDE